MLILRKGRRQVTDSVADIDAVRADTDPRMFNKIHIYSTASGKALDPKRVEQAVHQSTEKYCSASIMLGKSAKISQDVEIKED